MAKQKDMKDLSVEELRRSVSELDREVFELKNELAFNRKLEKPHLLKAKKKEKARALTILTQKQAVVA